MFNVVLLVLALVPPTPKDICNCTSAVDCQCSNLCICKECLAVSVQTGRPAPSVYQWKALTNGDTQHLSLEKDGKPVGTYRLSDGKYWDYSSGQLVECKAPIDPPKNAPKPVAPLPTFQPNIYYAPFYSSGGCSGGSCSGGQGGGRRR